MKNYKKNRFHLTKDKKYLTQPSKLFNNDFQITDNNNTYFDLHVSCVIMLFVISHQTIINLTC